VSDIGAAQLRGKPVVSVSKIKYIGENPKVKIYVQWCIWANEPPAEPFQKYIFEARKSTLVINKKKPLEASNGF
jgi:hypothetical protein